MTAPDTYKKYAMRHRDNDLSATFAIIDQLERHNDLLAEQCALLDRRNALLAEQVEASGGD